MRKKVNRTHIFSSIQTKIFLYYSIIIIMLILLASSLYFFTAYRAHINNYSNNSHQLAAILSYNINEYFEQIDSLHKKMIESDDLKEYIFNTAPKTNDSKAIHAKDIRDTLYSIIGYDYPFYHMNIVNLADQSIIGYGKSSFYEDLDISTEVYQHLVEPTIRLNGSRNIIPTNQGAFYKFDPDIATISCLRPFTLYYVSDFKAIMEIQITYSEIDDLINRTLDSYTKSSEMVIILDKQGELIYPIDLDSDLIDYYAAVKLDDSIFYYNPILEEREILARHHNDTTGFTTVISTPESSENISSSRIFFRNMSFIIGGITLFFLTLITYRIAKSISKPIIHLKDSISRLELDTISAEADAPADSSYNEIDLLNEAYQRMQTRLKKSLDDIVHSKTLTMHAQIMALQAQMDSHFLYNTLTIISIIAEENEDYLASEMCIKLTEMLRYISVDYSKSTTLQQELHHTKNYTDLMALRFGDSIDFIYKTQNLPSDMYIPRLVIQPLVENSVKYSRQEDKKLIIQIHSYQKDNFWYTEISDNGNGFSSDALANIQLKIQELNNSDEHPNLSISGMGLANIYLRLKLFYADHFIFKIDNTDNGTKILIGGKTDEP